MVDDQVSPKGGNPSDIPAHFLHSPISNDSQGLPQILSHRGFKGQYPENTICAIEGAIQAGTHALELDLHLTRDGEVVLSHDKSLQRCFGVKKDVIDCDWDYLKTLRSLKAPHAPMPRLTDVLECLRQPGREHIWVLLDIKLSNDPAAIMQGIAKAVETVPIPAIGPDWHRRLVLGCWSARYLPERAKYLPRYEMSLICVDMSYARQFLEVPRVSFNVLQQVLMGPLGRGFLEEARAARRRVFIWTVNEPNLMRWGIRHQVDGIITDEPGRLKEVCEEWKRQRAESAPNSHAPAPDPLTLRQRALVVMVTMYILVFGWYLRRRYLPTVERVQFEERKMT